MTAPAPTRRFNFKRLQVAAPVPSPAPTPKRRFNFKRLGATAVSSTPIITVDHVAATISELQNQVAKLTADLATVTQQLQHTEQINLNLIQTQAQIIDQLNRVTEALRVALSE